MTGKKQTKAKKKEETLLTTRGVKCALAATIADVEHGCGVKCVTQEKTSPVHVLLSRFYLDFILFLAKFYPDKIRIKFG